MAVKDKLKKIKIKTKPLALVALSVVGSIASKILTDKFEKQTNMGDINVNIYNYIINTLSESSILDFLSKFEQKQKVIEPVEDLSELDAAYEFIMNNVQLKSSEYIDISFQKTEESIVISYVFNKEYSNYFYQKGLSINELFTIANIVGETGLQLLECLEENLGYTVPIEIKVYTNYGDLLVHIENGKLKELNGIRPVLTTNEI